MDKSVIITGGFGFLGRNTAKYFKKIGYEVHGIGRGIWSLNEEKKWGFDHWTSSDITLELLESFHLKPELIVHCGGGGSVAYSIHEPYQDFRNTVLSTSAVLEFIKRYSPGTRIIYPSSAAVHGIHDATPIKTSDLVAPVSPYGEHKKMAEELCYLYSKQYGVQYTIIRFFSIYGPGLKKQLLWDASNKLTSKEPIVEFWGTGDEVRDWIHVDDAVSLIFTASQVKECSLVLNGGSGKGYSVYEILDLLRISLGSAAIISFNKQIKMGDPQYYIADISANKDWKPIMNLENGIAQYSEWFLSENS